MSIVSTLPLHLLAQPLTIQVGLADWVSATELAHWVKRLRAYATALGLDPAVSRQNIYVRAGRRSPSLRDRGLILDWLLAQHEIVDVAVVPEKEEGVFLRIALMPSDSAWPMFSLTHGAVRVE